MKASNNASNLHFPAFVCPLHLSSASSLLPCVLGSSAFVNWFMQLNSATLMKAYIAVSVVMAQWQDR